MSDAIPPSLCFTSTFICVITESLVYFLQRHLMAIDAQQGPLNKLCARLFGFRLARGAWCGCHSAEHRSGLSVSWIRRGRHQKDLFLIVIAMEYRTGRGKVVPILICELACDVFTPCWSILILYVSEIWKAHGAW
ncbi:hypothetical protein F4680DRAFT_183299 [Xylaria scruposa]|nr:hypothetical protein F4680DRAFT_183299 [Xylaria scruposa]